MPQLTNYRSTDISRKLRECPILPGRCLPLSPLIMASIRLGRVLLHLPTLVLSPCLWTASNNIVIVIITTLVMTVNNGRQPMRFLFPLPHSISATTRQTMLLVVFTRPTMVPFPSCSGPGAILGTRVIVGEWQEFTVISNNFSIIMKVMNNFPAGVVVVPPPRTGSITTR